MTAVDLKTGKPQWRFLAAPTRDELVVNGQLESRWPVYNSVVKDGSVYVAAGRHAEVDGGIWAWKLDAKTGAVQKRFRLLQPMSTLAPGGSQRNAGLAFRASREVTSNHLLLGGVALDDKGNVCLINRKWNKSGSRASFRGYWKELSARTKDRKDNGRPDPECANRILYPVDFDAWNGRSIDMVTALGLTKLSKKNLYYRSPFR